MLLLRNKAMSDSLGRRRLPLIFKQRKEKKKKEQEKAEYQGLKSLWPHIP